MRTNPLAINLVKSRSVADLRINIRSLRKLIRLRQKLRPDVRNLFVNRFQRNLRSHDARQEMLQRRAEKSADDHDEQQQHQNRGQRSAPREPSVEQDQWKAQ